MCVCGVCVCIYKGQLKQMTKCLILVLLNQLKCVEFGDFPFSLVYVFVWYILLVLVFAQQNQFGLVIKN